MAEKWHEGLEDDVSDILDTSPPPTPTPKETKTETVSTASFEDLRKEFFKRLQSSWKGIDKLLDGANNMLIHGKSLAYWQDYFAINIPQSPSMAELFDCMARTNGLITTVNHKLSTSQLTQNALDREVKSIKAKKFVAIKRGANGDKAPSNDMVAMQVDNEIETHLDQLMIAEYIVGFWENKRQALISTRKTLEAMMFGLSSEMKMKNGLPGNADSEY